jgi:hypothetical protein
VEFQQKKEVDNTPSYNYTIGMGVKKKTTPTAKTKEGRVKQKVRAILDGYGELCWYFMPMTKGYSRGGIPDFIGCLNGRMFGIETKSIHSSHKLTALQAMELRNIEGSRGLALVINEDNIHTLKEILDGCINGRL